MWCFLGFLGGGFSGVKEGWDGLIRGKRGITFFGYPWLDRVMKNSRTRFIFLIYYNFPYTLLYIYLFIPYYISAKPIWSYSRVKCNFELIKQVLLHGLCIRDLGVELSGKTVWPTPRLCISDTVHK